MHQKRGRDRRSRRTDALLRGALGALIREKPYEGIGVMEILNRANVGRSAFYSHFAGKDDLLCSCIHEVLRAGAKPQGDILWFGLPIFAHIEGHRAAGGTALDPGDLRAVHEHLFDPIAELIGGEVSKALRIPADLLVRWIASTFVLVLNWWVESDPRLPAREADGLFRTLVEPSLAQAFR